MLVESLRTYLLANTGVATLIGDRLFPDAVDQAEQRDAADMRVVGTRHGDHLRGLAGLATSAVVFDCYSMTRIGADAIALAIMYSGITRQKGVIATTDIRGVRILNGPSSFNDGVYPGTNSYRYGATVTLEIDYQEMSD